MLMGCGRREDSFENVSPGGLSTLSSHIAPLEGFQYERKAWFLLTAKQLRINVSDLSEPLCWLAWLFWFLGSPEGSTWGGGRERRQT